MKSTNMIGKPYGTLVTSNINFGPKDREFDNLDPKDKYKTNNRVTFHDEEQSEYLRNSNAVKRPASAAL